MVDPYCQPLVPPLREPLQPRQVVEFMARHRTGSPVAAGTSSPEWLASRFETWLHSRLTAGLDADGKGDVVFAPWMGEFGHWWISGVRLLAHHRGRGERLVCCQRGQEAFYATATGYVYPEPGLWVDDIPDTLRGGTCRQQLLWPLLAKAYPRHTLVDLGNVPAKYEPVPLFCGRRVPLEIDCSLAPRLDVVIGCRHRLCGQDRNWPGECWQSLVDALKAAGLTVGVIGKPPLTCEPTGCDWYSWKYPCHCCPPYPSCRAGNAAVVLAAMHNARCFVGTDTGVWHLACALRKPTLIWIEPEHPSRYIPTAVAYNPGNVTVLDGVWTDAPKVIAAASEFARGHAA